MTPSLRIAVAAFLAVGVVWGTTFMSMQLAAPFITAGQTPVLRLVFGILPILVFALATRALKWWHLRHAHHFAVQAVLAAGFSYFAYAAGTYRLDSSIAGVLSGSILLFASIAIMVVFRIEPVTGRRAARVLL